MKKMFLQRIAFACLVLGIGFISSCGGGEEDAVPAPTADFTTSMDGKTVTFTNNSTEAESYAWDFGDGATSTEEAPSHTYESNGSYIVELTVTNATGEDSKQEVLEIINIAIDGDFSDWEDVPVAVGPDDASGTLSTMKIENLGNNKLYVYIEGTDDLTALSHVFLNTDNDRTTGAQIEWRYAQGGEDYLIEGQFLANDDPANIWYTLFQCDGCEPAIWDWAEAGVTDFIVASKLIDTPEGKAYEFSIDLSAFPTTVSSEQIGIAVNDIDPVAWTEVGGVPAFWNENDNPEGTLYLYTFN